MATVSCYQPGWAVLAGGGGGRWCGVVWRGVVWHGVVGGSGGGVVGSDGVVVAGVMSGPHH